MKISVVPARLAASRLLGKPLLPICGRPMVEQVFAASRASRPNEHVERFVAASFAPTPEERHKEPLQRLIDIGVEGHFAYVGRDPIEFPDEYVDAAFASDVVEHLPCTPKYFLEELLRVLRPGGFFDPEHPECGAPDRPPQSAIGALKLAERVRLHRQPA